MARTRILRYNGSHALPLLLSLTLLLTLPAAPLAHAPRSDGGPARKGCGVLRGISPHGPVGVGATRVSCRVTRIVARGSVRGQRYERWGCTGRRTRFEHCHGRGIRRGGIVHWFAAH